jgi:hypothetical protein
MPAIPVVGGFEVGVSRGDDPFGTEGGGDEGGSERITSGVGSVARVGSYTGRPSAGGGASSVVVTTSGLCVPGDCAGGSTDGVVCTAAVVCVSCGLVGGSGTASVASVGVIPT